MKVFATTVLTVWLAFLLAACGPISTPTGPISTAFPTATVSSPKETLPPSTNTAIPTTTAAPVATSTSTPQLKILRIGQLASPDSLDPQRAGQWSDIQILQLLYDGLVDIDEKGNISSGSADKWELSRQGVTNTLTFHLRTGLKRSDGTTLTARDYEYSFKRAIDPRLADRPYAALLYDVKGAIDLDNMDPKKVKPDVIDKAMAAFGVKALDDATLVVTLENPVTFWPYIASTWVTFPTDRRQVDRDPEGWWSRPDGHAGNGPFVIKSLELAKKIVLVPNGNYWRGKPNLDRVELIYYPDAKSLLDAYRANDIEIATGIPSENLAQVSEDSKLKNDLLRYPIAITAGFAFNVTKRPFNDVNVRKAFSAAFDREGYIRDVLKGAGKSYTRWIPPGIIGAQPSKPGVPAYDPKAAIKTLLDNGYAAKDSTPDKPKVDCAKLGDIRLTFPANTINHKRFQFLASNLLTAFNCPVILEPADPANYAVLLKDAKTAPQISYQPWLGDYAHPQDWLSLYWTCNAFADRYGYCNKEFDALVQKADQEPDSTKSIQMYQQAEDLLLNDVPSIFGTYSENISLMKSYVIGPKDHIGTTDLVWPGESGPVWTYSIDLAQVPGNYPRQ